MLRMISVLLCSVFVSASPALAQDDAPFQPSAVLDAAVGDWNKDGHDDLVVLAFSGPEEEMEIGVYVYLRDADRGLLNLALAAPGVAWGGRDMYGQQPSVRALANGSFAIHTQNSGVGRESWEHTLSVAYRNDRFVAAGLTFNSFDRLQEYSAVNCDLNLLTGKGKVGNKDVTFGKMNVTLDKWTTDDNGEDPGLVICRK